MEGRPSSSRSSSSSSTTTSSSYRTPVAPKNIARLVKPASTLGAPININIQEEFKVPSIPDRPSRKPLPMARSVNLNMDTTSPEAPSVTPSRLKRLSLLARSPTLDSDHQQHHTRSITSPLFDENVKQSDSPTGRVRTNTDGSSTSSGTPRRSGLGIRSSISYSPAPSTSRTPTQDAFSGSGRGSMGTEPRRSVDSMDGGDLMGLLEETRGEEGVKGETLTERHAELLTAIAQKERRVNELKQELQTEQAALLNLKSRWSKLISSVYPTSNSTPMSLTSSRDRPSTSNIHPGSPEPISESPETQPGFQALLQDVLGGAPLVDPEVMEGGRRFIGNLMKTVGAAAGGTVPDGKDRAQPTNGIDLSSIGKMFSWGSSQPSNTVRIRPSDSGSSIKERRSPITTTPPVDKCDPGAMPDNVRKESYRDLLSD